MQTVAGGRLIVAVTASGRVLSYAGNAARSPGGLAGAYALSAGQALSKAAAALAPGVAFTPSPSGTEAGYDVFARGPFATVQRVKKATFLQAGGARPAYRVLFVPKLDQAYDVVVDAGSGAMLARRSLVAYDSEGSVYENFPGAPQGGMQVTKSFGPTPESPGGYTDPTGMAGVGGPTTFGNNANTYANYSNFLVPADQGLRPVSPTSQFDFPYAMNWQKTKARPCHRPTCWTSTRPPRTCSGSTTASTTSTTTSGSPRPPATSSSTTSARAEAAATRSRPRARGRGQRRRSDLHRPRQRVLPRAARRHPVVERHVPVGADQRRL